MAAVDKAGGLRGEGAIFWTYPVVIKLKKGTILLTIDGRRHVFERHSGQTLWFASPFTHPLHPRLARLPNPRMAQRTAKPWRRSFTGAGRKGKSADWSCRWPRWRRRHASGSALSRNLQMPIGFGRPNRCRRGEERSFADDGRSRVIPSSRSAHG